MNDKIIREAIEAAFQAQVALLFKNLCDGVSTDPEEARARFAKGLGIATAEAEAALINHAKE